MSLREQIWRITGPFFRLAGRILGPSVYEGGLPIGIFSESTCITAGTIKGVIVFDRQKLPLIPPDSEIVAAGLQQHEFGTWQCLWTQRDDAFLAGPSLPHTDSHGRICLEATYNVHSWNDPVWRRKGPATVRNLSGDYTSIISRWNMGGNYYHWFLDGLTRLIHLDSFPPCCRILIPRSLPPYARRSLELLGLADRVEESAEEDLRIEHYWFAGPTMLSGCPDPAGVKWLREHLVTHSETDGARWIYVERNAATRGCTNAIEVREWFSARGWEVVDPGTMTLDEQIDMFSKATAVAGIHGAAMTNLLWMPPCGKVIELMPSKRRNGCYAALALVVGLEHQSVVIPSDRRGNIHVSIQHLESFAQWAENSH